MKYSLKNSGSSKLAATYAQLCEQGKLGESLVTSGCGQAQFAQFAAIVMSKAVENGMEVPALAALFNNLALGNASQVRQAIGGLTLEVEGKAKPQSVSLYWNEIGGAKPIAADIRFLTE